MGWIALNKQIDDTRNACGSAEKDEIYLPPPRSASFPSATIAPGKAGSNPQNGTRFPRIDIHHLSRHAPGAHTRNDQFSISFSRLGGHFCARAPVLFCPYAPISPSQPHKSRTRRACCFANVYHLDPIGSDCVSIANLPVPVWRRPPLLSSFFTKAQTQLHPSSQVLLYHFSDPSLDPAAHTMELNTHIGTKKKPGLTPNCFCHPLLK